MPKKKKPANEEPATDEPTQEVSDPTQPAPTPEEPPQQGAGEPVAPAAEREPDWSLTGILTPEETDARTRYNERHK